MTPPAHKVFIDETTEWRLLATLIKPEHAEYINKVSKLVFTDERIPLFTAMQSAYVDYGEITYEGIKQYLKNNIPGELLAVSPSNIDALLDEAIRLATKRLLNTKAQELKELSYDFKPDEDKIAKIMQLESIIAPQDSSIITGAQEFLTDLDKKLSGDYNFISSGMNFLDNNMGGEWPRNAVVIIMGDSGSGKTALIGDSMLRMADPQNEHNTGVQHASLFFSFEMTKKSLISRWLSNSLSLDGRYVQSGKLTRDQSKLVETETKRLQTLPIYVIDDSKITVSQMTYSIREHVKKKDVHVVFIDYLELVNHHPYGSSHVDLADFTQIMKDLAKELDICIVILAQVNRTGEGMDKLRGSSMVQNIVDVIIELIVELEGASSDVGRDVTARFWKNRLGPTSITPLLFVGKYQRFTDGEV